MAADKNTIVTNHPDGTQTTEVVDWTAEENAAHAAAEAIAWKGARQAAYPSWQDQLDIWLSFNHLKRYTLNKKLWQVNLVAV